MSKLSHFDRSASQDNTTHTLGVKLSQEVSTIMGSSYGFGTVLNAPYEQAVAQVKEALKAEGFGVLSEINVKQTLKEKIGVEMQPYVILGACNPQLAHRALTAEPEIGQLLPCNVVVRGEGDQARVDIADPEAMLSIVGKPELDEVAAEAKQRLQRVVAALSR
ncbi:MAG: DUF302 domain-containing protein [Ktedonobacterales bacterium]